LSKSDDIKKTRCIVGPSKDLIGERIMEGEKVYYLCGKYWSKIK